MSTNDEYLADPASLGTAMAAFLISINTLVVLKKAGAINEAMQLEILQRAEKVISGNAAENPKASEVAASQIKMAKEMFRAMTAGSPGESLN